MKALIITFALSLAAVASEKQSGANTQNGTQTKREILKEAGCKSILKQGYLHQNCFKK